MQGHCEKPEDDVEKHTDSLTADIVTISLPPGGLTMSCGVMATLSGPDRKDSAWGARAKPRKSAKSQSQGDRGPKRDSDAAGDGRGSRASGARRSPEQNRSQCGASQGGSREAVGIATAHLCRHFTVRRLTSPGPSTVVLKVGGCRSSTTGIPWELARNALSGPP